MLVRGDILIPVEQSFVQRLPGGRASGCAAACARSAAAPAPAPSAPTPTPFRRSSTSWLPFRSSERANRVIDHDQDGSMEIKKREGYF